MLLFDVHQDDGEALKKRTRKGQKLWSDFEVAHHAVKEQVVVTSSAPKLPENPVIDDIWEDEVIEEDEEISY